MKTPFGILCALFREPIRPFLREPILGIGFAIFYHLINMSKRYMDISISSQNMIFFIFFLRNASLFCPLSPSPLSKWSEKEFTKVELKSWDWILEFYFLFFLWKSVGERVPSLPLIKVVDPELHRKNIFIKLLHQSHMVETRVYLKKPL